MSLNPGSDAFEVEGHRLTDDELKIYGALMRRGTIKGAARDTGFSVEKVERVSRSNWFKRL